MRTRTFSMFMLMVSTAGTFSVIYYMLYHTGTVGCDVAGTPMFSYFCPAAIDTRVSRPEWSVWCET